METMIYGYARCSTDDTKQDIQGQIRELKSKGATDKTIYKEYESGTNVNRAEFNKLLDVVKSGDTIVTTEISRLARSTKQLVDIIEYVETKGIKLEIGSLVFDCRDGKQTDIMTKAMLQIVGVFAELERNMISERVKRGMLNAKAEGKVLGRPKTTKENIPESFIEAYNLVKEGRINVVQACKMADIKKTSYYKYKKIVD